MKHLSYLLFLFILFFAACQPAVSKIPAQPTLDLGAVIGSPTTAVPAAAPVTATTTPDEPTAVPVTATAMPAPSAAADPHFSNLKILPNQASLTSGWPLPYTPLTTNELYAVWDYSGLTAANEVERIWFYDDAPWLERRELWDSAKYGMSGQVQDIFVYDYEPHLAPGLYRLVLKVDGVEMASAEHTIPANTVGPEVEPGSGFMAAVQDNKTLVLRRVDGSTTSWISAGDIVQIAWIPGGRALVYSEQVVIDEDLPGTLGQRHNLWLQDVVSGEKWLLGNLEENLHTPVVSPDGRHIALLSGTLFGDACGLDADLYVLELTDALQRGALLHLNDFTDIPVVEFAKPQPSLWDTTGDFMPTPGQWVAEATLEAGLTWICADTEAHGIYQLELNGLTAVKVAELTRP